MKSNTIQVVSPEMCSGCAACMNACPKDCITMQFDEEGFSVPVLNEDICVECGMCQKACPALHPRKVNDSNPQIFMARSDESILYESTSGAAFAILSKYVLDRNGYVCGAAYNEEFEVRHQVTNTYEGLKKLKKTKYVQCQPGMIYRKVKELLQEDNYVLFSGAPCQVAGLHNYLGKDYEKLYTVDILCHGAPAPLNWKKYLSENFDISTIKDIEFRYKTEEGARPLKMRFIFKDGTEMIERTPRNPFYYHFSRNIGLRQSCGNCEGAISPRVGDFSIGDFWGADVYYEDLVENAKGLSMVFCNNKHAEELIPHLEKEFAFIQKISLKEAMTKNRRHKERTMPENRQVFFDALKNGSTFNDAVALAVKYAEDNANALVASQEGVSLKSLMASQTPPEIEKGQYDIAIYGNTLGANYGGLITYYALYRACEKLGYSTVMIRSIKRRNSSIPDEDRHGTRFCEENMNLSDAKYLEDFSEYNGLADTYLLGSDQIWNQALFKGRGLSFYLDFINNKNKKVSYSASFGFDKPQITPNQIHLRPAIYYWLNQLDSVAVREADGVDICKYYFDREAKHVLDPVFLLDPEEYKALANRAPRKQKGKYMATYQLTPNKGFVSVMQYISEALKLPRVNMGPGSVEKWKNKIENTDMPWIPKVQLEEWLHNIANSRFVVTDSFHGMCFSILLKKDFILFMRDKGPTSRVKSLLSRLGLEDRWFTSWKSFEPKKDIIFKKIDYDRVHSILKQDADDSLRWLKKALAKEKRVYNPDLKDVLVKCEAFTNPKEYASINAYLESLPASAGDTLIMGAFDSSKTLVGKDSAIQSASMVYLKDTSTGEESTVSGDFAHLSTDFHGAHIAVAAGKPKDSKTENFREMIIELGGKKNIYKCNKHSGFIATFTCIDEKTNDVLLKDFVYIDDAGNLTREL